MKFDWDDVEGNTRRRLAGLALEKRRQTEIKRKRQESRALEKAGGVTAEAKRSPVKAKKH